MPERSEGSRSRPGRSLSVGCHGVRLVGPARPHNAPSRRIGERRHLCERRRTGNGTGLKSLHTKTVACSAGFLRYFDNLGLNKLLKILVLFEVFQIWIMLCHFPRVVIQFESCLEIGQHFFLRLPH